MNKLLSYIISTLLMLALMVNDTYAQTDAFEQTVPSFDTWTSLFLFVSLQALFVCIALFNLKGAQSQANKLLAFLLLTFSITLFSYVVYWTGYYQVYPQMNGWFHPLLLVSGSLFYLYVRNIALQTALKRSDIIHFAVPILVVLALSPMYINNIFGVRLHFLDRSVVQIMVAIGFNTYLKLIYIGVYLFLSFRLYYISKFNESYMKPWFQYLLYSFAGYYLTIVMYYALINFSFFDVTWDYMISFAMSFFIFCVSFLGYIHPQVLAGKPVKNIVMRHKYKNSGLTEAGEKDLRDTLVRLMNEEQLFLNNDLSLDELALKANTTRHNVSLVINKYFEQNFFDFINQRRIEFVKELFLLPECQGEHVIQLAYRAGFNNKVSFNKAFKKFTGQTPLSYKSEKAL